jgi:acyl carrier protein
MTDSAGGQTAVSKLEGRLRDILSEVLEVERGSIELDSSPEDLYQWDSIRHMMLITAVESEFGIHFGSAEIWSLLSLRSLCEAIRGKVDGPSGS